MIGLICVVTAGIMWGTLSIYVNTLQSLGLSSVQCSVIRYAFSFLILCVILLIKDRKGFKIKWKDLPLFLAAGVLGLAGFSLTYFLAMEEIGGASVPSLILNSAPVFVIAVSPFIFKEKIKLVQIISIVVCIAGIVLVTGVFGGSSKISPLGIIYGVISALSYAAYIVVSKILLKKYTEYTVSTYAMLCAFLSLLPVCLLDWGVPTSFGWKGTLGATGLVLMGTLFPFLLYSKGLKKISAAHASVFGTVDPATSCLVGLLFFKEDFSIFKIIGIILVLGAIAMQALANKENKENTNMKLHNIWGYGQLFGFSALDGPNRYYDDFVGTLTHEKIGVRFELDNWIIIKFPVSGKVKFHALTGDIIDATVDGKPFFMTFAENDTLVGYSPILPEFIGEIETSRKMKGDVEIVEMGKHAFGITTQKQGDVYKFCIHHAFSVKDAEFGAMRYIDEDVDELKKQRYAYYENMPACKDKKYEQMYYKAISVNKVNVRSAEGKIPCTWTTPDRVPHRMLWLWDSVFHALAMVTYNEDIAKSSIDAVMSQQLEDGFIPHMMNPEWNSDVTQPQVLAWGVWELYKKTGDKEYLKKHADGLEKYLAWDNANRDKNGNGLLEWATNPNSINDKCDECGQDDSPRFDFDDEMDAIDFSTFACRDAFYLSKIFAEIGDNERAEKWANISNDIKKAINERLWCEEDGVYYDRLFSGDFSKILTPSSFFPMMAGVPSKEQAEKMVKVLTDKSLLWTKCPLPTVAKNHPAYSTDMWRGGVWLNLNYFVIIGLKEYGYEDLAEKLRVKTLKMVQKWYKKCGTIFEFFDPENKTMPYLCERKGVCPYPPDWRKQVHSIVDFNWSNCFTLMLIQKEFYGVDK